MSRTRRTARPWDYRWQTLEDHEAYLRRAQLRGHAYMGTYTPWQNHNLTWGPARQFEYRRATRLLRNRTRSAMARQLAFWFCACDTEWPCPLHAELPQSTPDWHPGTVRVGYWD